MNEVAERFDPETGEIVSDDGEGASLAVRMSQAEVSQAVADARKYPRNLKLAKNNITTLVMLDDTTAGECVYALPRGGKPIKGPSIRFAEIVASQYGNCHVGSRIVEVDRFEKVVVAEGVFIDYENNLKRTAQVRRRISDKNGKLYSDDMIVVTGNAAASIALRNAILGGIPKALWREAYDAAEKVIAGDVKTMTERRAGAIAAFGTWGVTPEQVFASLEVRSEEEIGLDQIATLLAMHRAIKSGEQAVEDYFPPRADKAEAEEAARGTAGKLKQIAGQGAQKGQPRKKAEDAKGKQGKAPPEDGGGSGPTEAEPDADPTETPGAEDQPEGGGDDADPASEDEEPEVSDEEARAAFERGQAAYHRGMKQAACPKELRKSQRLFDAWNEGWEVAESESREGPQEGD